MYIDKGIWEHIQKHSVDADDEINIIYHIKHKNLINNLNWIIFSQPAARVSFSSQVGGNWYLSSPPPISSLSQVSKDKFLVFVSEYVCV